MNRAGHSPLLTDLYQLTMAGGYFHHGVHNERVCFHLFYRRAPFGGSYAVVAGVERALSFVESLSFNDDEIAYLKTLSLFSNDFLDMLQKARCELDIWAMPEGTLAYPHEPILRVEGPLWQAQLVETALLCFVNFETLVATKAARICDVARDEHGEREAVVEFGLRRAQGPDGGFSATRAAYLGGAAGTSNVLAAKELGIPAVGTHAHSWVMRFGDDRTAFSKYAEVYPSASTFLVDTFDTGAGVEEAIRVGQELSAQGHTLGGIRLDSGNLATLSIRARHRLDEAGFQDAKIVASNDLDEYRIAKLKAAGARIDTWGVGTRLSTAYDQPALGGVYKLGAVQEDGTWSPRIKLSENAIKRSIPGRLNVRRFESMDVIEGVDGDASGLAEHPETGESRKIPKEHGTLLLTQVLSGGKRSGALDTLDSARERAIAAVDALPDSMRQLENPEHRFVGIAADVAETRARLQRKAQEQSNKNV